MKHLQGGVPDKYEQVSFTLVCREGDDRCCLVPKWIFNIG